MSFVFDRNFDAEFDAARRGEEPVIGAVFTRAQFDEAVANARREGFEAGVAQGSNETLQATEASASQRQLSALEAVTPALRQLIDDADRHHATLEAQMVGFVLEVFEQLAPDVSAKLAKGQAEREAKNAVRMRSARRCCGSGSPPTRSRARAPRCSTRRGSPGSGAASTSSPTPISGPARCAPNGITA